MKEFLSSISYPSLKEDGTILVNPEISLEPLTPEHFSQMWSSIQENQTFLAKFLPWARVVTKDSFAQHLERSEELFRKNTVRNYAIRVNNSSFKKEIVGSISLKDITFLVGDNSPGNASLGYYLFEKATGRNFMHEAAQALCAITYTHDNIQRFSIIVDKENTASRNVALKLNAKFEGELRKYHGKSHLLYSYVLPDDFIQQNELINERLTLSEGLTIQPFDLELNVEELAEVTKQARENLNHAEAHSAVSRLVEQSKARAIEEFSAKGKEVVEEVLSLNDEVDFDDQQTAAQTQYSTDENTTEQEQK
ncbi:hypothetical protein CKF54_02065 [Psittacicella hinzii]|uniref:N-acetyltransferase domain-containing protein n=1 Tax=Psittacicella hinzii TaxID=2028575 RepID=A0A3A1YCA6_9GAMM|nr:GNAT family N-acetyltransferase [Psittacicella hinzii]RIY33844.1 hypothetical protein CKF54_02065 [Psittacicella hinzii]